MAVTNYFFYIHTLLAKNTIFCAFTCIPLHSLAFTVFKPQYNVNMDLDSTTPIAIVGLSFQLPGGAISEESLWSMLMEKRCASSDFPADRLDGSAFYHPDRTRGDSVSLEPHLLRIM